MLTGPRPLFFFIQATELNYGIRDMHTLLLEYFLDYVDVHHCLPSKVSCRFAAVASRSVITRGLALSRSA